MAAHTLLDAAYGTYSSLDHEERRSSKNRVRFVATSIACLCFLAMVTLTFTNGVPAHGDNWYATVLRTVQGSVCPASNTVQSCAIPYCFRLSMTPGFRFSSPVSFRVPVPSCLLCLLVPLRGCDYHAFQILRRNECCSALRYTYGESRTASFLESGVQDVRSRPVFRSLGGLWFSD